MNFYELEKIYVNPFKNERDNNNVQKCSYFLKNINGCIPVSICTHFAGAHSWNLIYLFRNGMRLMRIFFSLDI